ncbi:hypothetical protein Tco_0063811 [Tanacetum coccineum]
MAKLQVRLQQEKADMETNRAHTEQENVQMESDNAKTDKEQNALNENELQIERNAEHIIRYWESSRLSKGKRRLMASAEMRPCFSSLCAHDVVMSKIRDCMKVQLDENQSCSNVCFHEVTKTLQSSS